MREGDRSHTDRWRAEIHSRAEAFAIGWLIQTRTGARDSIPRGDWRGSNRARTRRRRARQLARSCGRVLPHSNSTGRGGLDGVGIHGTMEPYMRVWNRTKLLWGSLARRSRLGALPVEYIVETTAKCNLYCPMCPRETLKQPKEDMTSGIFDRLVEESGK